VYGLPKATIYAGSPVNFSTFNVPSLTAPVTNAGQPMISSPFSFFLAAVPGTGYRLLGRIYHAGSSFVAKYAAISAVVAVKPLPTTSSPPGAISWKPVRDLLTA